MNQVARERNEVQRALYIAKLRTLSDDPRQFVFVDETAKDRLAGRGARNDVSTFFQILIVLDIYDDIDGFIVEACEIIRRGKGIKDPGEEAGTVDSDRFVAWVRHKLCPCLSVISYWVNHVLLWFWTTLPYTMTPKLKH